MYNIKDDNIFKICKLSNKKVHSKIMDYYYKLIYQFNDIKYKFMITKHISINNDNLIPEKELFEIIDVKKYCFYDKSINILYPKCFDFKI